MPDHQPGQHHTIQLDSPAGDAVDGFLLGNGALGATVYGRAGTERFDLNLDTVWSGGPPELEHSDHREATLHSLRSAIARGRHVEADHLARTLQTGAWTQSYQPLGGLLWRWVDHDSPESYNRRLDLSHAEATTTVDGTVLTSFVSHPDQVLVAYTTTQDRGVDLDFESPHPGVQLHRDDRSDVQWLTVVGRAPSHALPDYIDANDPITYDTGEIRPDGTVDAGMGWAVVVAVDIDAEGTRRLIAAATSGYRGPNQRPSADLDAIAAEARRLVHAARRRTIRELTDRHRADYNVLFDQGRIEIDPAPDPAGVRAQTYYDLGRYLLISSSRAGTQPINLQGIWNTQRRAAWSCNYTTNINVAMNYWAIEQLGLSELHQPLHELTKDLATSGRSTAQAFYGARGATVHHNTDLWRFSGPVSGDPQWANWQFGLAWLAQHLLTRLEFDWSTSFAEEIVFPVLSDVTAFILDQLVVGPDGDLVVSPSTSPEHRYLDGNQIGTVTAGATLDQELAHATFTGFGAVAERLNRADDALVRESRDALRRLHLPRIAPDGTLDEWADPALHGSELGHRHLSHLYGCYPGTRITETRTPALFAAVRASLADRLVHGSGYTGWSQAWVLCLAARLRDADLAEQAIRSLIDELSSDSLLDLHPHPAFPSGRVFQIDGNLGAVAGMIETLLQSHDGAVSFLPALPEIWPSGRALNLHTRGGHIVHRLEWRNQALTHAVLETTADTPLIVETCDDTRLEVRQDGHTVDVEDIVDHAKGRRRTAWQAVRGARYELSALTQPE